MRFDPRQSNPAGIILILVTIGGLIGAVAVGQMVARNDFVKIGMIAGAGVAMLVVFGLGKNIWLLIPLGWLLTGKIPVLPIPLSLRDLCIIGAFLSFVAFVIFKKLPKIKKISYCDYILGINIIYLATVYVRNPVGVRAFGSDMVGGAPYFSVFTSVLAYWVLQHVVISVKEAKILPWLLASGATVVAGVGVLTQRIPSLVPFVAPFYSGINVSTYMADLRGMEADTTRSGDLLSFNKISAVLTSKFPPIQLLLFLRPFWSVVFYASIAAIFLSGFRSGIMGFVVITILCGYFHSGLKDVVRTLVVILFGVMIIIALQASGLPVHPSAQRALSFIPAPWDPGIVQGAEASSEWRFEMWKIALESDKYIKNKLFGDGFGFSAYELNIQLQAAHGFGGYLNVGQTEAQLVTGAFHSGPISAIRFVGAFGLLIFLIFLIACARFAWSVIIKSKGTPFFPLALFIGTAMIYKPFAYVFIFGGFDGDFPESIMYLAFLNLTSRGLSDHLNRRVGDSDNNSPTLAIPTTARQLQNS